MYNAVIDDPTSVGGESREELKALWERSKGLRLTMKSYLMRETIAITYVKSLNEISDNSEVCSFLTANLPILAQ